MHFLSSISSEGLPLTSAGRIAATGQRAITAGRSQTLDTRSWLIFGGLVSSGFVWMAHGVSCSIDSGVIALYPRIIFLEIILDYQFYRDYLRRRPRGESERRFIEKCENISAPNTAQLWREIHTDFNSKDFPRSRRIHRHYRWMAFGSVLVYWFTIAATVLNTFTDITR